MNRAQWLSEFDAQLDQLVSLPPTRLSRGEIEAAKRVYLMGASSQLGQTFVPSIAPALRDWGVDVLLVDDRLAPEHAEHHGCKVLSTEDFVIDAQQYPGGLAVTMVNALFADGFFRHAAQRASVRILDVICVLDLLGLPVIYQHANVMREQTLKRLEDYKQLARRFDDELSIRTLAAMLKLRASFDRQVLLPVLCSTEDEYFTTFAAGSHNTFTIGRDEVFVDIGAHRGTVINKFLLAADWSFKAIHAFEPDLLNYQELKKGHFASLPNLHAHNVAVSDECSTLRFSQTGTMGSRLDDSGNVEVQVVPLDEIVDYATFLKMDVEGHETRVLSGARQLLSRHKPRLAVTCYHYADDMLDIVDLLTEIEPTYKLRLRHHSYYYYDTVLYAHSDSVK